MNLEYEFFKVVDFHFIAVAHASLFPSFTIHSSSPTPHQNDFLNTQSVGGCVWWGGLLHAHGIQIWY
jgi:hypothetical protein